MSADTTHNGWRNYETWVVNLWMDNEQGTQEYWRERAADVWRYTFALNKQTAAEERAERSSIARSTLADAMKAEHEENTPDAVNGSVYADLLSAALGEVDWIEIADAWLEGAELEGYEPRKLART